MNVAAVVLTVIIIIVAVLLVLVVLAQNSKGGGLSSSVGISNQVMGVQRSTENVEKITWILVICLAVISVGSGKFIGTKQSTSGPTIQYEPLKTQYDIPQNPAGQQGPTTTFPGSGGDVPANSGTN